MGTVTEEAAGKLDYLLSSCSSGRIDAACGTLGAGVIHTGETQEQGARLVE